jgi:ABC-type glycerol-3-phosphate transport system permease component
MTQKSYSKPLLLDHLRLFLGLLVTLIFIFPIVWMIATGFKTGNQAFSNSTSFFFQPSLDNYRDVFFESDFKSALITSLRTVSISVVLTVLLASGIAYPMARFPSKGMNRMSSWIISLRIVPPIVTIIPLFLLLRTIKLTGSIWSLVLVYTFMNMPLAVWLLRGFFKEVPREIEEAAEIDGLDNTRIFFKIVLPLSAPGVVATALLSFVFAWNDFLFANILSGATTRTATVGLTEFVTPVGTAWTTIMAAGTLVVIPVWVAALFAQKYLVRGLTMGSVK